MRQVLFVGLFALLSIPTLAQQKTTPTPASPFPTGCILNSGCSPKRATAKGAGHGKLRLAVIRITRSIYDHCDTHAMDLWRFPELIIGHEDDGTPSEAVCSTCGKWILEAQPLSPNAKDAIMAFSIAFQLHIRAEHRAFLPN